MLTIKQFWITIVLLAVILGVVFWHTNHASAGSKHHVYCQDFGDYYCLDRIVMNNGKVLVCIEAYQYDNGGPSLSCNWPQFNKDSHR